MTILLILLQLAGLSNVARSNELTRQAEVAYARGDYKTAARAYSDMVTKYSVDDDAVMTNLAHSYFRAGDVVNATRYYTVLAAKSQDATLRSMANTQLGVISARQNNYPEAGERFKEALRQDPNNTLARLNYERLMRSKPNLQPPPPPEQKKTEEEKKKEEQKKKEDQKKQEQQGGSNAKPGKENKPQQSKEQEEKKRQEEQKQRENQQKQVGQQEEEKKGKKSKSGQHDPNEKEPDPNKPGQEKNSQKPEEDEQGQEATREQLKKMQLSEEKSRQILDAMRASEVQYLQQKRFRRRDQGKRGENDW